MPCTDSPRAVLRLVCAVAVGLLAATADNQAQGRRVTFRADDGVTLGGAYYEPAQRRPAPAILLLHMLGRSHRDWDGAAVRLADAGYAVLALDFRPAGALEGYAADIRAAKGYLRERPDVQPSALGLAGASIGANLALLDAAADPGVLSVALLSPGLDYRGLRADAAMKGYGARPALLVGSTRDPYTSRSIRQLITIGPGAREVRLTDAVAHGTVMLARDPELAGALVDWFKRTLL